MRRQLRFLLPVFSSLSLTTCVDNDTSMYVEAVLAPSPPECTFTADPSAPQLLRGTLDVAFLRSYQAAVLVANQLTPRGIKNQLRAESQGVELRGAEIRLSSANGELLDEFSVPTGGFVHPNTSESPGYGLALVTLIPPARGQEFLGQLAERGRGASRTVIASIRVFGTTLGDVDLTSGEFTFPIDVCYGCLVDYPIDAVEDPGTGEGRVCVGSADGVSSVQCIRGQDAIIDCRTCAATLDICEQVD